MKRTPLYTFARTLLPWLFQLLMPSRVYHAQNMPKQGGVVLCCNHASMTDPLRLAYSQRRQIFFMAKEELFRNPLVKFVITALGAFPVSRGRGDKQAISNAEQLLKDGNVLGIFIEGTRSKDGSLQRPKPGAVLLAYRSGVPVLPCCITAKEGGLPGTFRTSIVSYGKPIAPEELGIENGTPSELRNASRMVMDKIAELREKSLEEFALKKMSR